MPSEPAIGSNSNELLNAITDGFISLDRAGRLTYLNPAAARLMNVERDAALGRRLWNLFPEGVGSPFDRMCAQAARERTTKCFDAFFPPKGNWCAVRAYPTPQGLSIFFQENNDRIARREQPEAIRELEASQLAVRHSEERLRLAAEMVGLSHYEWNPGDESLISDARLKQLWGLSSQSDFTYQQAIDAIHPDDRPEILEKIAQSVDPRGNGSYAAEYRVIGIEDQVERWISTRGQVFFADGVPKKFIGTAMEITERKHAEDARRQSHDREKAFRIEAQRATAMKDEFIAVLSHELRTPLTAILLWAKLIRTGAVKITDCVQAMEAIEQSALAQQRLIEDSMDLSSILSGKLRLNFQETSLAAAVEGAIDAIRPIADAKGVTLFATLEPDGGLVRADPDRIRQIVWNLLTNAVKFTDTGGRVDVALRRVDGSLQIRVTDTGQGIHQDYLPHVFDRFSQGQPRPTQSYDGLGLGLAISRQLAELHGGMIDVESPGPQHGATFTATLPLRSVEGLRADEKRGSLTAEADSSFALSPVLKDVRILLVEDERETAVVLQWLLENCEASVTAASSTAAALQAFEKAASHERFDILISDIGMPVRDGYDLIEFVRAFEKQHGLPPTPAIALTAYVSHDDRQRAIEGGFQEYLPKPVEANALIDAVARRLGRA